MAKDAEEWLNEWTQSYVYAEARSAGQIASTVRECEEDAQREGLSRGDLDTAAGGSLYEFLLSAIKKSSGE